MADLKACFEEHGYRDVATYIASGNVLFSSSVSGRVALTRGIEKIIADAFALPVVVVVRTDEEMRGIVEAAPEGFGARAGLYRYDVIFLKEPLTASSAVERVRLREGVDQAHAGRGVLYHSRLISRASQSLLSRLASDPVYKSMTIRNWNTTTKLAAMMQ
jgi:uncharacterized protein (DUF1697 family)